jgi:hypothetical protein
VVRAGVRILFGFLLSIAFTDRCAVLVAVAFAVLWFLMWWRAHDDET